MPGASEAELVTDLDADVHRHSVERIFPGIGETAATADVLQLLNGK